MASRQSYELVDLFNRYSPGLPGKRVRVSRPYARIFSVRR